MLATQKRQLLLTYSPDCNEELPLIVASNCLPFQAAWFEPAGVAFHSAVLRLLGFQAKSDTDSEEDAASEKKDKTSSPSVDSYQSKGKKKSASGGDQQDHYALLGLGHLRFLATDEQIRKAYRETALKHHPDKQAALLLSEETEEAKEAKKEEIDRHFKAVQEAYEVLIDSAKRRVYDSIDEFDDEIPGDCASEDFYKVYGPVFVRNGRWSVAQPVPPLGQDDAPIQEVDAFYDFWYSFKSWREFPHADEFDLEQAESREHKRWMERQNGKLREKAKKEENSRIRTMVENAYKKDPRILRRKEEEKAEKLRKKQAKHQAKRDKEEEAARVLEEERRKKEEEEKKAAEEAAALKKVKEKEKKLVRKERARLRAAAANLVGRKDVSEDFVEDLCMKLEISQLRHLCERLEATRDICQQALILQGKDCDTENGNAEATAEGLEQEGKDVEFGSVPVSKGDLNKVEKKAPLLTAVEKKERPWSKEEVDLLRKAVAKYPKGTSQRWEVVSNYVGTGRSVDEILRAVKNVLSQKPDSAKAFDSFLLKRKTAAVAIDSPLSTRDDSSATEGELSNGGVSSKVGVAANDVRDGQNGSLKVPSAQQHVQANGKSVSGVLANGNGSGIAEQDHWSEVQVTALVKACKSFPKDTAQRWERIAAAVPGKTKAQCMRKFAELRENFRNKKGAE